MIKIKSLNINYQGEKIITDIDDCIIYTSKSILFHKLNKIDFWFDDVIYDLNKEKVFYNAEFTEWGIEFLDLIKKGLIVNYEFLTSSKNRHEILSKKFDLKELNLKEGYSDLDKIKYINELNEKVIYIDDKYKVTHSINNSNIKCINYPF